MAERLPSLDTTEKRMFDKQNNGSVDIIMFDKQNSGSVNIIISLTEIYGCYIMKPTNV